VFLSCQNISVLDYWLIFRVHPRLLVGFVLLDLLFYVYFFVDRCLFFLSLCCLSFFDLRILITPLVSSYSSVVRLD
jgi:hypothetical protein